MKPAKKAASEDRRVQRTRKALRDAFVELFFERGFDGITIADITSRANVGRSTFYEHYRGKNAVLLDTVRYPFEALATVVDAAGDAAPVRAVLEHFWANRGSARSMQRDSSRRALARILAQMIEERLARSTSKSMQHARIRLVAAVVAQAQLGPIGAWLAGDIVADARSMAEMLGAIARTVVETQAR